MKKLNNKGFTLVELLAVVVILAVVMGIAITSVITAMNNSRKGSLEDSAISVERAFTTKYSEALVTGSVTKIYEEVGVKYDFSTASTNDVKFYKLSSNLSDELNLSSSSYKLSSESGNVSVMPMNNVDTSFVAFDGKKVVVCLVANDTGNYYVANAAGKVTSANVLGQTVTFNSTTMWACSSDEANSWATTSSDN